MVPWRQHSTAVGCAGQPSAAQHSRRQHRDTAIGCAATSICNDRPNQARERAWAHLILVHLLNLLHHLLALLLLFHHLTLQPLNLHLFECLLLRLVRPLLLRSAAFGVILLEELVELDERLLKLEILLLQHLLAPLKRCLAPLELLLLRIERLLHLKHVPPLLEQPRGRRDMVERELLR